MSSTKMNIDNLDLDFLTEDPDEDESNSTGLPSVPWVLSLMAAAQLISGLVIYGAAAL